MHFISLMAGAALAGALSFCVGAVAEAPPPAAVDPLGSPRWGDLQRAFFSTIPVVFDDRVKVIAPGVAENPQSVPVAVDAGALTGVEEVLVLADFNPIVKVLRFVPDRARASLAFRLKLQQSSPIRAAARTADGVWHLGGTRVTTTGGGCTRPSAGTGSPRWQQRLNEVSARRWPRADGGERIRVQVIHPMDTGLADGIPVFHLETLEFADRDGQRLMVIEPFEPVAENPLFTIEVPVGVLDQRPLRIAGRDNNGNPIQAEVAP